MINPLFFVESRLVRIYLAENSLSIKPYLIKKALVNGDYSNFHQENSDFVLNLFSVKPDQITSPLVKLSLLRLLSDRENLYQGQDEAYLTVEVIQDYFEPTGLSKGVIKSNLKELLDYRLIDPYDPTEDDIYEDQRLKANFSGRIHVEFSLTDRTYVSQMALVTRVRNYEQVAQIREVMKSKLTGDAWSKIISVFVKYCLDQDCIFVTLPSRSIYDSQSQLRQELRTRWTSTA